MDLSEIMKMAGQMREQMESVQQEAEKLRVHGEAGGGMVKVEMNGRYEIVSISIDPAIVVPDQVNFVEDLVRAAINQASARVGDGLKEQAGQMASKFGLDLPDFGGPGSR